MKHFQLLLIVFITLFVTLGNVNAEEMCSQSNAYKVIKVFSKGIALNESFKKSAQQTDSDENEYRKLRAQNEQYIEDTVFPCVKRAAVLLKRSSRPLLIRKLMELAVSFENASDETISYALGEIFAANPSVIEVGVKYFSGAERKIIIDTVQAGWTNARTENSASIIKNRDKRIKLLPK